MAYQPTTCYLFVTTDSDISKSSSTSNFFMCNLWHLQKLMMSHSCVKQGNEIVPKKRLLRQCLGSFSTCSHGNFEKQKIALDYWKIVVLKGFLTFFRHQPHFNFCTNWRPRGRKSLEGHLAVSLPSPLALPTN